MKKSKVKCKLRVESENKEQLIEVFELSLKSIINYDVVFYKCIRQVKKCKGSTKLSLIYGFKRKLVWNLLIVYWKFDLNLKRIK